MSELRKLKIAVWNGERCADSTFSAFWPCLIDFIEERRQFGVAEILVVALLPAEQAKHLGIVDDE